jgi:prolipoprotein diacylglyceryltransferase
MKLSARQISSIFLIGIGTTCHYYFYVMPKEKGFSIFLFFAIFGIIRLLVPLFVKKDKL